MPHRYFTTEIADGAAVLRGSDAHHLARVMRAKQGDTVILCDGNAVEYTATITGFGDECVEFRVEPGYPSAAEPSVEVTLLAGYPKQDKLEQIIKHGVELGCTHFIPFFSRYCVAAPKKEEQKNERKKLKIALITGAEGGFAAEEAEMAAKAGAKTVGLGPRILRCETAPLAVLSAVMTLTGNLE